MTRRERLAQLAASQRDVLNLLVAAGLAALEQRVAHRAHQSNENTVRSGLNGPGVLEVTGRELGEKSIALAVALDELDLIVDKAEAAERQAAERERFRSLAPSDQQQIIDALKAQGQDASVLESIVEAQTTARARAEAESTP
jgi:hypothetical protein